KAQGLLMLESVTRNVSVSHRDGEEIGWTGGDVVAAGWSGWAPSNWRYGR
ncbi:hypothetical protein G6539_30285, partial [Streptomyces albidoflavus]|nr:hypothetical protein [Streptomyces albidoflavus]